MRFSSSEIGVRFKIAPIELDAETFVQKSGLEYIFNPVRGLNNSGMVSVKSDLLQLIYKFEYKFIEDLSLVIQSGDEVELERS